MVAWCLAAVLLTLLAGIAPAAAQAQVDAPGPVELHPNSGPVSLQGRVGVFHDPTAQMSLDRLLSVAQTVEWDYPPTPLRMHGPAAWWLKIEWVSHAGAGNWVLAFPTTAIRDLEFYGPFSAQGQPGHSSLATGLMRPYASRPLSLERFTVPLPASGAGVQTVYLRVQNSIAQNITPTLWPTADYVKELQHKRLFDGMIYGALLALLIYNLALAGVFRDVTYVYYVLTGATALLTVGTFSGHTAHYLWPHHPWWIEHSYVIWPALWLVCAAAFARAFLETRKLSRWADRTVLAVAGLGLSSAALGVAGQTATAQRINEVLALGGVLLITVIALMCWRKGRAAATWYLLGQFILFLALVGVVLVAWGWWDAPFVLAHGLQFGMTAEMLVFALALSVRIRRIQKENILLGLRATHLSQVALTDPLTGLANRRGLTESAHQLLREPGWHAIILFDLDGFKPINDTHGHEVGDQVLVAVGRRLLLHCRDSDVAARLGGDEFVVLLGHCPGRAALEHMVERLCHALDAPIQVGSVSHPVSASAGVAVAPEHGQQFEALLHQADLAMYAAKKEGRHFAFAPREGADEFLKPTS